MTTFIDIDATTDVARTAGCTHVPSRAGVVGGFLVDAAAAQARARFAPAMSFHGTAAGFAAAATAGTTTHQGTVATSPPT